MTTKKEPATETIIAYKGFNQDWKCRDFQFEIGKTYEHDGEVKACNSGFHSCENPLDVLNYYNLCDSRFAIVKASGEISRHNEDSKVASAKITVEAELKLPEFIAAAINWIKKACEFAGDEIASGNYSQLAASGDYSQLAASGNSSKLAASGYSSKLAASGYSSIVMAAATGCIAKAGANGAIALSRWVESEKRYRISVAYVGENGIEPDVFYTLNESGEFVRCEGE